jgi:heme O synthase-like polyprenyltransferase
MMPLAKELPKAGAWALVLLFAAWAQSAAAATQQQVFAVSIKGVTTTVLRTSTWAVNNNIDRDIVRVPVGANKGWAQVR